MPEITLFLDENQHRLLSDEYKRIAIAWLRDKTDAPPPFEQWLGTRLSSVLSSVASGDNPSSEKGETGVCLQTREELHVVDIIEKLVSTLSSHGFALAQVDRRTRDDAIEKLARALAQALALSPLRARRLEELIAYYAKSAREVADAAHVGITSRVHVNLHEAARVLADRCERGAEALGTDRALGRVEGGLGILMLMQVLTREAGREKAKEFKKRLEEQA